MANKKNILTIEQYKKQIYNIIENSKKEMSDTINSTLVITYWKIGEIIVKEEQNGKEKAEYGKEIINSLSKELKKRYGNGFSKRNIFNMRKLYINYPKVQTLKKELTWSHYLHLLKIDDINKRKFYENETIRSNWRVRELDRQISSLLFERLTMSIDKEGLLEVVKNGQKVQTANDLVKDPYILEFLNLSPNAKLFERDLESALIEHLQVFLLELGKGFSFVSRQQRISMDEEHFYIDLVFYNYILKCFVLIDLKVGKLKHQDIGQMQMYVNYYKEEMMNEGDNEPIGILLCAEKSNAVVKYTLLNNDNIFASKYKLYLPTEEELKKELLREKELIELNSKLDD